MESEILKIRGYLFSSLKHLEEHRQLLADIGELLAVKGTVILSPEGVNLSIAGTRTNSEQLFEACKAIPGLEKLKSQKIWAETNNFSKLKIKIKDEIIRMNTPEIHPEKERAKSIDCQTLSAWLDDGYDENGMPIKVVDTRNKFEVKLGSFNSSFHFNLDKFSDFPKMFEIYKSEIKDFRVITVCTGGIRCEKATLYMNENGLPSAVQLDGGILDYLNKTEANHWNGECFVFENTKFLDNDFMPNFEN